jgi:sulfatase maturation enzyme AslB (radical SAM superfamily)
MHTSVPTSHANALIVVVRVTSFCAQACRYCGFSREVRRDRREIDSAQLMAFGQQLSDYQSTYDRPVLVSWLGGEPYQWSKLWPISTLFSQDYGLSLGLTTNGVALCHATTRKRTLEIFDQLTISVDGPSSAHDLLRPMQGGFAALRENCLALRNQDSTRSLWLRANMVLTRSNIEQFEDICMELVEWGINELTFNQLGGNDRPEFYPANRLLIDQVELFRSQLLEIRARMTERGLVIQGSDAYLDRIVSTTDNLPIPIDECWPGNKFLFVDEHGRMSPCSFTNESYGVEIGEIRSSCDLIELPLRFRTMRKLTPCRACGDCHATHVFDKFDSLSNHANSRSAVQGRSCV